MKQYNRVKLLMFVIGVFLLSGCHSNQEEVVWNLEEETTLQTDQEEVTETEQTEIRKNTIFVDICGAVKQPGVYELEEGARVYEAINLAGGLLETADDTAVNRAEVLTDGVKIRILTKEESKMEASVSTSSNVSSNPQDTKVNINTADVSLLTTLPGIGQTRAADIIAYRTEHGMFVSIEEIMNVGGIKESTYNKIKDKITTE